MLQAVLRTEEVRDAGRRHVPVVPRPAAGVDAGDEDLLQSSNEAVLDCAARAELAAERERIIAAAPPGTAVPTVDMGHTPVVADFVEAIREGRPPLVDGAEGRRAVALITALYESSLNDSQPVTL